MFNEKTLALNPSVNPLCVSFITNIQLWFTTLLTNTTVHNGGMHKQSSNVGT